MAVATTSQAQPLVTLRDLFTRLLEGRSASQSTEELLSYWNIPRDAVRLDWDGQPCVPADVAAEALRGHELGKLRDEALRAAHAAAMGRRNDEQAAAVRAAFEEKFQDRLAAKRKIKPLGAAETLLGMQREGGTTWLVNGRPVDVRAESEEALRRELALQEAREAAHEAAARFDEIKPELGDLEAWLQTREGHQTRDRIWKEFEV